MVQNLPSRYATRRKNEMWKVAVWMHVIDDGSLVRKLMKRRGVTGVQLAKAAECTPALISYVISGKRTCKPNVAHAIAERLEVPLDLIFVTKSSKIITQTSTNTRRKVAA